MNVWGRKTSKEGTGTNRDGSCSGRSLFHFSETVLINYEVHGHGGTPVVFLHGFAAALATWHDIAPFFPPERYTLYLLDLKGFGCSSKPRDGRYRPEDQAAMVTAFLDAQRLRNVVLVAHSLGGGIALLTCIDAIRNGRENLVSRLILIDSAAYPQTPPPIMLWLANPVLGRCILHLLPLRFMVHFTLNRVFHDRRAITSKRVARYMTCFGREGIVPVFVESCRQLVPERYAELTPLFRTITIPTLIVWGTDDPIIPLYLGARLHGDIPDSRLVLIHGCGHVPQEERPEDTYAAIRDFLEGN